MSNDDTPVVDAVVANEARLDEAPVVASAAIPPSVAWYDYIASWFYSSTTSELSSASLVDNPTTKESCNLQEILVECSDPPVALQAKANRPDIRYAAMMIGPARNAPDSVNIKELVETIKSSTCLPKVFNSTGAAGGCAIAPVLIVDQQQLERAISVLRKTETRPPKTKFESHSPVLREYMQRVASLRAAAGSTTFPTNPPESITGLST